MASRSGTPAIAKESTRISATGHEQPQTEVQRDEKTEVDKQSMTTSVFEFMQEEQVQNAVKFLLHPKVRGSPVIYQRSFLEKKGLTKEEIDEAFRRLLDPSPTEVAAHMSQGGQVTTPSIHQPQAPIQTLQTAAASPTEVFSSLGTLKRSEFHWSRAILAVGLLISGAGTTLTIKNKIIPRLKSWICKVVKDGDEDEKLARGENFRPSMVEEASAAAKAASEAVADLTKAILMLNSKYEDFEECARLLKAQLKEMESLIIAIRHLEGRTNFPGRASVSDQNDRRQVTFMEPLHTTGTTNYGSSAVKYSSPPMSVETSIVPPPPYFEMHPSSKARHFMKDLMCGLQRSVGRSHSTIRDNTGPIYPLTGDSSVPWWQPHNVGFSMYNNKDNLEEGSNVVYLPAGQPITQAWVPPPLPQIIVPEAAEALGLPKSTVQIEKLDDDLLVTPRDEATEVQRNKDDGSISETEIAGGGSGTDALEIQEKIGR